MVSVARQKCDGGSVNQYRLHDEVRVLPQAEPAFESHSVVSASALRRQIFEPFHVAAADDDLIRFKSRAQALHNVLDALLPFSVAFLFPIGLADIVLVGFALAIRKMGDLHRLGNVFDNHRGAQTRAEPQKQHASAVVRANRLHERIVDDANGTTESALIIIADPAFAQIDRFPKRFVVNDRAGISHGNDVIGHIFCYGGYGGDHFRSRHCLAAFNLAFFTICAQADLYMTAADIDCKNGLILCHILASIDYVCGRYSGSTHPPGGPNPAISAGPQLPTS
ncbi:hypothetical protein AGR8A_Lc10054 [Agrobacterium fabrum str. J-07]|nr:hypothetical protein AGR8A_Lc10054 [Agrobacterium fabrum str. J-07]